MKKKIDPDATKLSALSIGRRARVVALAGGRGFQKQMTSMGLAPGRSVEILKGTESPGGPLVVACGDSRMALGRGMADKVLVRIDEANPSGNEK